MADAKKPEGDEEILYQVIGLIVIIFIISSILANFGFNFLGEKKDGQYASSTLAEKFSLSERFPVGKIKLGNDIINKKEVDIYRVPGAQILGKQLKREVGKPIEGPVVFADRVWWRIDYPEAPDGWVRESSLTDYVWMYRIVFIFPILFTSLVPFLILLSIILFILIIVVMVKASNLEKIKAKKKELQKPKTITEKIKEEAEAVEANELAEENEDPLLAILPTDQFVPKTRDVHNKRWAKVETLINSHNVNDWKQAIIEADIILDEMLDKMGYKGDSIGDKLKQVEESDFLTLNQAWEAHKIRNRIAHKGSQYVLSRDDAERAFNLFKEVFQEFYFI